MVRHFCGTAENITQLGIYRAIQGIGGGISADRVYNRFDIFPPEKRKMGGLFGAVFGLSSIFGPLLGAYITDYISWHWVFYINLPLGVLALILLRSFIKNQEFIESKIDWSGTILVGAVICLMFALELGGQKYDWDSTFILSLFVGFAILIISFIFIERKVEEPIISFEMFKQRLFGMSTIIALCYGAAFMSATVYIPLFIQGVYGGSATNSGLLLLPMMLGSVVTAQLGGF